MRKLMTSPIWALAVVAALGMGLAACSSSDDPPPPPPPPPPVDEMTEYEKSKNAIEAAETVEAAEAAFGDIDTDEVSGDELSKLMKVRDDRVAALMAASAYTRGKMAIEAAATADDADAAYAAVDKNAISGAEAESLMMALSTRKMEIATAGRIDMQKDALMTAAGMIDTSDLSTQALVDAARTAIAGLRQALTDAVDVSDADKAMYMTTLNDAEGDVDGAQGGIDTATRRTNQMTALSSASMDLQAALAALSGSTPTQAQLDAANDALDDLNAAITGGADLTDTEKAPYVREAANAMAPIQSAQMAFDDAEDDAEDAANVAMAATAAKLYANIYSPAADANGTGTDDVFAAYNTADTAIEVTIGTGGETPAAGTPVSLSENKNAMVADNHGWEGKMYADRPGGDMYEAIVYSNVEEPTMGKMFGGAAANDDYEYALASGVTDANAALQNGEVTITTGAVDTTTEAEQDAQARITLTGVTRTAGTETFKFAENEATDRRIDVPGSYHGVSGTYWCTPNTRADGCTATVSENGFALLLGTWVFKPTNPKARVMESEDEDYISYGWWIKKAENDGPFTASAFVDVKGTVADIGDVIDALNGTATYEGGAAGKYALASSTGGTNDAGHFTARATLEADFTNNTDAMAITGALDMFMGADDQPRNWMVKLNGSAIANNGGFGDASDTTADNGPMTVWTIGEMDAAASGNWTGNLRKLGDDGVPEVATGTFYSEFGTAGKMVGAFGANLQ